jgi:shikimate 5-dehydrogenase
MLVSQGVIGFKLWTGVEPDPAVMRKALEDVFAGSTETTTDSSNVSVT